MSEANPYITIMSIEQLRILKDGIHNALPDLGSGRAGECIARGLNRSTHDGLAFELRSGSVTTVLDTAAFSRRAIELGYSQPSNEALEATFLAVMNGFAAEIKTAPPLTADQLGRTYARPNLSTDAEMLAIDNSTGLPLPYPGSIKRAKEALFVTDEWNSVADEALSAAGYEPAENGNFADDLLDKFRDGVVMEMAAMAVAIARGNAAQLVNAVSALPFDDVIEALQEGRLDPEMVDFEVLGCVHAAELIDDGSIDFAEYEDEEDFEDGIKAAIDTGRNDVLYAAEEAGYERPLARDVPDEYVAAMTETLREAWMAAGMID